MTVHYCCLHLQHHGAGKFDIVDMVGLSTCFSAFVRPTVSHLDVGDRQLPLIYRPRKKQGKIVANKTVVFSSQSGIGDQDFWYRWNP